MSLSRRNFLASGSALAASALTSSTMRKAFAAETPAAPVLTQFGYGDVELLDGPLRQQVDTNHQFYRNLDEDRLLKPYRQRAGLPAPGDDMGGWYSWAPIDAIDKPDNGFAPGHTFGQYVSALSRYYAATGDKATQEKVHRLVRNLGPAVSEHFWFENRFPAYTYDKLSIGLLDAHQFAAAPDALAILNKVLDSVEAHLPPGGISRDAQYQRPHINESFCWDEPYTLPENLFIAYQRGAGQRYRDLAMHFLADDWYFNPLASGENVLPHKHAYSHVNAMSSAMQAYLVLGSEKHLRAAKNGFDMVRTTQSFAAGGWGPNEDFRVPGSGEVGESLTKTHSSFETPCGSYAHFKITRYLMRATRDSHYGDSMERVLYNCILGAKPIAEDGHAFYYSDYNNDGSKVYHPQKWHCCTGTFSQVTADYGISAYLHDDNAIYVNLFVPSRVKWTRGSQQISLTQKTSYPLQPSTEISVSTSSAVTFPIFVRIPAWAGAKTAVAINGKRVASGPKPGEFLRIHRAWKNNDRIEIEFDIPTTLEPVDAQHPNLAAVVHGPLALFAVGKVPEKIAKRELFAAAPVASGSTDWQVKTGAEPITLRPFTAIGDEHYRLYQNVEG